MSTTSLKLPDDKQRAVSAAKLQGVSTHVFMGNAIEKAATLAECRANFIADAHAARKQMWDTGTGYDADEVHAYIQARIAGKKAAKPKAISWRGYHGTQRQHAAQYASLLTPYRNRHP
ncbi:MAG: hypothetical protein ACHP7O_02355 [Burkholderiales bacterium]